ncbi:MAG: HD domain-containing protein [Clostridia bacterium]|nr:HD domain-containing protein [Clostridia bacterium]
MIPVPSDLKKFAFLFPVPLYLVGGYVRDALSGRISDDYDICSSLPAEKVASLLSGTPYVISLIKKDTGTVAIACHGTEWQYTAFRTDRYEGGHTPAATYPTDIEGDARRRDFKANAVYYDIKNDKIVDPLGGVKDIENRILSTTRSPKEVFSEDGLRLMRLARQAAETGFSVHPDTLAGARENAEKIDEIAPERIRVELERILLAPVPSVGLKLLHEEGVLARILPELDVACGLPQRKDYHRYDVFGHILSTVDAADKSIVTAALFHDIGKPVCYLKNGNYHGHDEVGAELCKEVMRRLRYCNKEIEETVRLVRRHMFDLAGNARENTVRLFVQKNADVLDKLCFLMDADMIGCGYVKSGRSPVSLRLIATYEEMKREKVPFSVKDLLVRGNDIPEDVLPVSERTKALNGLLAACAQKGSPLTTKEKQLQYIIHNSKGR